MSRPSRVGSLVRAARAERPPAGARARALARLSDARGGGRLSSAAAGPLLVFALAVCAALGLGRGPVAAGSGSAWACGVEAPPGACLASPAARDGAIRASSSGVPGSSGSS